MENLFESLKIGIWPGVIVAIYLVLIKLIDNRGNKNQAKINSELISAINNLNSFVRNITNDTIINNKDKCRAAIKNSMTSFAMKLITFTSTTIVNNNIDANKEAVYANIRSVVNSEYYSVYSTLSLYKIDGVKLSTILNKNWIDVIEKDIISSMYNDNLTKEAKILSFQNKINFKFQSYTTYMINSIIK